LGDVRGLSQHDDRPFERIVSLTIVSWINWLFARGHAADVVLAVIAIELAWLVVRRGWSLTDALCRLAPGALMLVALRAALTGQDWRWVALPLLLSFPVHLADLVRGRDHQNADRKLMR
jgi:hypothetical protein